MGRCIVYTGIRLLLLIHPFISSFFFLSIFLKHYKFSSHFSQELWGLEGWWCTCGQWVAVSSIPESGCCCLFISFISTFFLLSNFQTLKFFVTLFAGTVRPRRLKLGTHMDSGQMYRNQAVAAYSSRYFFIFLSLQFSNITNFHHTFLRNYEALKIETWYTRGQWADVYRNKAAAADLSLYSVFFLSSFQTLKIFVTLFSGTVRPRRLRLGAHVDDGGCSLAFRPCI